MEEESGRGDQVGVEGAVSHVRRLARFVVTLGVAGG